MRRRGCLTIALVLVVVCIVVGGVLYALGLPRLRDSVQAAAQDAFATEVARQLAIAPDVTPAPGAYVIDEAELNRNIELRSQEVDVANDFVVSITPERIGVAVQAGDRTTTYTARVQAVDGRLDLYDTDSDGFFDFFLPTDDAEKVVENAVNNYLTEHGLRLAAVELGQGTMTLTTEPAA